MITCLIFWMPAPGVSARGSPPPQPAASISAASERRARPRTTGARAYADRRSCTLAAVSTAGRVGHASRMSETLALARRYVDLDRPESALEVLERARGGDLEDTEFWAIRAKSLLQLERSSESAEAAENGLEHDPEDV